MKFRYIIAALAAVVTLAAGCTEEEAHYLDAVKVSSSYVAINQAGGSQDITVDATASWSIASAPEWVTISPASGNAGSSKVTFSAEGTVDGREGEVLLSCNGSTQHINVIQGLKAVSKATCKEVVNGIEGKTYLVTGICTAIANTQYGNWYLNDGTDEIYVYGTVNAGGAYDWASFGIEVGDEVTVQGARKDYNGTIEFVDALFISVNKSLMKVEEVSESNLPSDGGEFTVTLSNKGEGVYVEVPEAAKEWLSIKSIAGNVVTFAVAPNTAGPRAATLVFKTKKGGKEYSAETSISQEGLSGTLDVPFTVAEAIKAANDLGGESAKDYYIKGKVSQIANNGQFGAQFGNGTFWISDDGEYHDDLTQDFEAYRVLWFNGEKWVEGNLPLEVGAEVMIYGKITLYKGTAETSSGKAYVYSVNGVQTDENGLGTVNYPFNVAGGIAAASATTNNVYVAGKISKMVYTFSAQFGTATFWMSESGEYAGDATLDFEAYSVYYFNNTPWAEGNKQVAEGDDVTVYGQLTVYKGTSETNSKKAWLYSLNGETE